MKPSLAVRLVALVLPAVNAFAATTSTVVDLDLGGGVTQRILHVRPDSPIATLISVPGGDGRYAIQNDGSMNTITGQCGPFSRTRLAFADRRFAVVLVDTTSAGGFYNASDITKVVNYVRSVDSVPVWMAGGSASTANALSMTATLPADLPVGGVFFSPSPFSTTVAGSIRRPAFVIYHSGDNLQVGGQLYNALGNATPRGVSVQSGGTDTACGYHLFQGLDTEIVTAITDFMALNNPAQQATGGNFQGLWWRSPAGSENGWGVNVAHQGDVLFATWYTYDVDGSAMWLFSDARKTTGNTYTGQLYQARGSPFSSNPYDPARFAPTTVGSATLSFADASNGTFSYTVNGTTQSKAITRFAFSSPVPTCTAGTSVSSANYTDLWWRAGGTENGWGVNLVHQGDTLFATWYTYAADGSDLWLVMDNAAKIADRTYRGNVYRTTSGPFNAYDPSRFGATQAGTGTFTFTDGSSGTFSYTVDGVTQSKPIARYVFATPPTTCN
jgi:hypothetical protein